MRNRLGQKRRLKSVKIVWNELKMLSKRLQSSTHLVIQLLPKVQQILKIDGSDTVFCVPFRAETLTDALARCVGKLLTKD
jgi:hypothetical protein